MKIHLVVGNISKPLSYILAGSPMGYFPLQVVYLLLLTFGLSLGPLISAKEAVNGNFDKIQCSSEIRLSAMAGGLYPFAAGYRFERYLTDLRLCTGNASVKAGLERKLAPADLFRSSSHFSYFHPEWATMVWGKKEIRQYGEPIFALEYRDFRLRMGSTYFPDNNNPYLRETYLYSMLPVLPPGRKEKLVFAGHIWYSHEVGLFYRKNKAGAGLYWSYRNQWEKCNASASLLYHPASNTGGFSLFYQCNKNPFDSSLSLALERVRESYAGFARWTLLLSGVRLTTAVERDDKQDYSDYNGGTIASGRKGRSGKGLLEIAVDGACIYFSGEDQSGEGFRSMGVRIPLWPSHWIRLQPVVLHRESRANHYAPSNKRWIYHSTGGGLQFRTEHLRMIALVERNTNNVWMGELAFSFEEGSMTLASGFNYRISEKQMAQRYRRYSEGPDDGRSSLYFSDSDDGKFYIKAKYRFLSVYFSSTWRDGTAFPYVSIQAVTVIH